MPEATCLECGEPFKQRNRTHHYCQQLCQGRAAEKRTASRGGRAPRPCITCARPFRSTSGHNRTCKRCIRLARLHATHHRVWQSALSAIATVPPPMLPAAPVSRLDVDPHHDHRQPRRFTAGNCAECSSPFVARSHGSRYCSETCATKHQRRRQKHTRDKRIRTGAAREPISLPRIAERDGWRCHICKGKVTRGNWSLDHLIPLSHGGAHTRANVALAHHRCNSLRSDTGHAQLLLVG